MSKSTFQYAEIMDSLVVNCPPTEFYNQETIAFRWVFEKIEDEENFLPQYFKNPPRFQNSPPSIKCQSVGLSFFHTEQDAVHRFQILTARMAEKVRNKIGKNVAKGKLDKSDGECNKPDTKGHFTFHPYKDSAFANNFQITQKL